MDLNSPHTGSTRRRLPDSGDVSMLKTRFPYAGQRLPRAENLCAIGVAVLTFRKPLNKLLHRMRHITDPFRTGLNCRCICCSSKTTSCWPKQFATAFVRMPGASITCERRQESDTCTS